MNPLYNIDNKAKIMINDDIIDCTIKARYKKEDGYYYRVIYNVIACEFTSKGHMEEVPYPINKIIKESELFIEC